LAFVVRRVELWYRAAMVKTLELALSKVAGLSEAAQEQIGRELLERIDALARLRGEIAAGLRELDAGKGGELDVEEFIKQARTEDGDG
jgi:hypothetical protein